MIRALLRNWLGITALHDHILQYNDLTTATITQHIQHIARLRADLNALESRLKGAEIRSYAPPHPPRT